LKAVDLGYQKNGYQHIYDVKQLITDQSCISLEWKLGDYVIENNINLENKDLFIGTSLDNPVNRRRTTLIVRGKSKDITYKLEWKVKKGV
jgi:dephospho-CoA kinase